MKPNVYIAVQGCEVGGVRSVSPDDLIRQAGEDKIFPLRSEVGLTTCLYILYRGVKDFKLLGWVFCLFWRSGYWRSLSAYY